MECPKCHGGKFSPTGPRAALETWICSNCGEQLVVHANYGIPAGMLLPNDRFIGIFVPVGKSESLKALIKLKRILRDSERFQASKLEAQAAQGIAEWHLGEFFDFEIEQLKPLLDAQGLPVSFIKIE